MGENWLKKHYDTRLLVKFDFKKFFEVEDCTVDDVANAIGYTDAGAKAMILRGTIKRPVLRLLEKEYPNARKYLIK